MPEGTTAQHLEEHQKGLQSLLRQQEEIVQAFSQEQQHSLRDYFEQASKVSDALTALQNDPHSSSNWQNYLRTAAKATFIYRKEVKPLLGEMGKQQEVLELLSPKHSKNPWGDINSLVALLAPKGKGKKSSPAAGKLRTANRSLFSLSDFIGQFT
ncbi:MAG: hypothetical protein ACQEP8_03890 [Chlamydiota bacterium]